MNPVFYVFLAVYMCVLVYTIVNLAKSRRVSVELSPAMFRQYVRHSATKLYVFSKVLKVTLSNLTTVLILLTIVTSSFIAAVAYSDRRTEFTQTIEETVSQNVVLIKMSEPVSRSTIAHSLRSLLEKSESYTYLYRITLERGISLKGLPEVKWVVIGIDGELLFELNISEGEILTGCRAAQTHTIELAEYRVKCAQEFLYKFKIAPLETLLPILGYIGMEPVTPSLDIVMISDISTIAEVLGLGEPLVTDLVLLGEAINLSEVEEILEVIDVSVLHYYYGSTALIISSVRIMTLEATVSMLFVIFSCVSIVAVAYRSLLPEFKAIHERLHYIGLPQWGTTITLLMHVVVAVSLGSVVSSTLAYQVFSMRQAVISVLVSIMSGFMALLTLVRELSTGTASYGSYTPTVERHELVLSISDVSGVENLVGIVKRAIESNEFFELEEFEHKQWGNEILIHCRANFKELWGVALSGLIGVTKLNGMVRMFIETSVSSIEEISESMNNSIRALFVSKLIGKLKTLT